MNSILNSSKVGSGIYTFILLLVSYYSFAWVYDYFQPKNDFQKILTGMSVVGAGAFLFHMFYIYLYIKEPKSAMKYRSNDKEFPWKENPKQWQANKLKFSLGYVSL